MISVKDTLKATEARIAALKQEIAKEEALLPGLRYAVQQLNGHAHKNVEDDVVEEPKITGRLRLGDDTKIVLELLAQKGSISIDAIGNKIGDKKKAREALRNLSNRKLVTKDDDSAAITNLGRVFMREYEERH